MSKKSFLLSLLTTMMVAILSVGSVSCGGDDDDSQSPKPNDGNEQTDFISNQDPEGTIVVNMNNGSKDNWIYIDICSIHIDDANNFVGMYSDVEFASVGEIKGLSSVTSIPSTGWSKSSAVVPGTGYVVKCGNNYARMYVVDYIVSTSGAIMGATVKYQSPFQLPIILESSSLTFTSGGGSQSVRLKNPTSVSVERVPVWCTVSTDMNSITVSVTENLSAQECQSDIILKNSVGSVILTVIQKGSSSPKFEGGRGMIENPYQIKTAQQLDNVRIAISSHFVQTADIDLEPYLDANGSGWNPINSFSGSYDGQGHYIKGLWINRPTTSNLGLFAKTINSTIHNLRIKIGSKGIIGDWYIGGIAGVASGSIWQCSVSGDISGTHFVAGICGYCEQSLTISECYSEGNVLADDWYTTYCGGISAANYNVSIRDCYSTCSLKNTTSDIHTGTYAIGHTISRCYFAGKFEGDSRYFFIYGTYSYYDKDVANVDKDNDTARTTAQMMTQSNYESWDFVNTWKIKEGQSYPTLRCFDQ